MPAIFEAITYDGRKVRLTEVQWIHIVFFHPEVVEAKDRIRETLENPDEVTEGATENTRIYYKFYQSTPVTSKYLAVVIQISDSFSSFQMHFVYLRFLKNSKSSFVQMYS